MKDETIANVLDIFFYLGLGGVILDGATFVFLHFELDLFILTWLTIALAMAVGARIAMRIFYDWIFNEAFVQWQANPSLGLALDPEMLMQHTQLSMRHVSHAVGFLERKAKATGIYAASAAPRRRRAYRFPRAK